MKRIFLLSFALVALSAQARPAREGEVSLAITKALIATSSTPEEASVILNGYLPGDCYRWSRSEAVKTSEREYRVQAYAMMRTGPCRPVLAPYSQVLTLPNVGAGEIKLEFRNPDGTIFLLRGTISQ